MRKTMPLDTQPLADVLQLQQGDILVMETPYEDATDEDMFPFIPTKFTPSHSLLWITDSTLPVAHSVRDGYRLPGIRLTRLPEGKYLVYRHQSTSLLSKHASEIMKNWALSTRLYSKDDYLTTYPQRFWLERQSKDLKHFYGNEHALISGPSTPYLEPKATEDILDVIRTPSLLVMGDEGLRRAIKFASRRNVISPHPMSKGQRCTAALIAAYQAAILAPIVKEGTKSSHPFKQYKGKPFEAYADEVLIDGWQDTETGKLLLLARKTNDYTLLFDLPFAVDQRYATPKTLHIALRKSPSIEFVGQFSYFRSKIEIINKHGEVTILGGDDDALPAKHDQRRLRAD